MMNDPSATENEIISQKRRSNSLDDQLIPLINVVFLMLIFFMVAGHIEQQSAADIDVPVLQTPTAPLSLATHLQITAAGQVIQDNQPRSMAELRQMMSHRNQPEVIVLKADRKLTAQLLMPVLEVIRQNPGATVKLVALNQSPAGDQ
jgi:biopolymer transport protein ExbD